MAQIHKKHFCDDETSKLIDIWGEHQIINMFEKCKKHIVIYTKIADEMSLFNYNRTPKEIRNKINNLKQIYNKTKPKSGESAPAWKFFDKLHEILGVKDKYNSHLGQDSFIEGSNSDTTENSYSNARIDMDNLYGEVQYLEDETENLDLESIFSTPQSRFSISSRKSNLSASQLLEEPDYSGTSNSVRAASKTSKRKKNYDAIESLIDLSQKNQNVLEKLLQIEEKRDKREEKEPEQNEKSDRGNDPFLGVKC